MQDDGVIYVAGHPLLDRRCTKLQGCIRLRQDILCQVGAKLYSLTPYENLWIEGTTMPIHSDAIACCLVLVELGYT